MAGSHGGPRRGRGRHRLWRRRSDHEPILSAGSGSNGGASIHPGERGPTSWSPAWSRLNGAGEDLRASRPTSRRLIAFVDVSNCGRKPIAYGPRVEYGDSRIIVTFFISPQLPKGAPVACAMKAILRERTVRLAEPIGTRDLYDGGSKSPHLVWRNPGAG